MPDYQMISSIKKHSGPVACGKCGHIIVFRKNIPVGRKK